MIALITQKKNPLLKAKSIVLQSNLQLNHGKLTRYELSFYSSNSDLMVFRNSNVECFEKGTNTEEFKDTIFKQDI